MSIAPLSSASIYGAPLSAFQAANRNVQLSVAKLSSGNRLINASTDVAALSISSRMKSQVIGLKAAQVNAAQGTSLTQIAYGGLTAIQDVLNRMQAIATQGNSGSLTDSERGLLQTEFSSLKDEIDRLADSTAFGDIKLLNGAISNQTSFDSVSTGAEEATGSLLFSSNPTAGQTVVLSRVTLTAGTEFAVGGSTAQTVENLKDYLNSATDVRLTQARYARAGDSLVITQKIGGTVGEGYLINRAASTASFTVSGHATQVTNIYTLDGAEDNGLGFASLNVSGTVGDALVSSLSNVQGSSVLTLTANPLNGETLRIDDGDASYVDFTFATTASAATDIQIGSDIAETLRNAVKTLSQYSASNNFSIRQLEFERSGDTLIIRNKTVGNPTDLAAGTVALAETLSNGALSSATVTGGAASGINPTAVANANFLGTISGFTASYVGADSITASITVGDATYTADITDTTPATATTAIFSSENGGNLFVQLASGGMTVANQTDADTYAARLDAAFATLTFTQTRNLSSFSGVDGLVGASAQATMGDFNYLSLGDVEVTAPTTAGGDGTIDITLRASDGTEEVFRNNSNKGVMGAYERFTFTSLTDSSRTIRITNGATENSFTDATEAATFETALKDSFGASENAGGRDFQLGVDNGDVMNIAISDMRTSKLFAGASPTVSTQANAQIAQDLLNDALDYVNTAIANVGSYQQRFDFASQNLESWRTNLDSARSVLADTDVAEESTFYATEALKANVASAMIAQLRQLQSGMLNVLKTSA